MIAPLIECQRQLIYASLDDFTPNATFPNYLGGQFGGLAKEWRDSVINFLCTGYGCGLLRILPYPGMPVHLDASHLHRLLIDGDEIRDLNRHDLWNALYFEASTELIRILDVFGLRNWEASNGEEHIEFTRTLKEMFEEPWNHAQT